MFGSNRGTQLPSPAAEKLPLVSQQLPVSAPLFDGVLLQQSPLFIPRLLCEQDAVLGDPLKGKSSVRVPFPPGAVKPVVTEIPFPRQKGGRVERWRGGLGYA